MSSIHGQLTKIIKKHERLQRVKVHLKNLQKQVRAEETALKSLSKQVDRDQEEWERMEKLNLKSVFHKVLGNKEEQIEKERQQYLQTFLKYNEAKKSLEILLFEKETLEKKLESDSTIEAEYHRLIQARESELIRMNKNEAVALRKIFKEKEKKQRMIIEVEEAITAGERGLHTLNQMIGHLNKARNWGQWDMANRGPMPSMMKHSAIDKARSVSYQAKIELQKFSDELRDVYGESFNFPFQLESFSGFLDMFFDNLISDWIIQNKIKNSLANCLAVRDKVVRLVGSLKAEVPAINQEIKQLEQNRKKIIITSN